MVLGGGVREDFTEKVVFEDLKEATEAGLCCAYLGN